MWRTATATSASSVVLLAIFFVWACIAVACDDAPLRPAPTTEAPAAVLSPEAPEAPAEPEPSVATAPPVWRAVTLPEFGRYGLASVRTRGAEIIIGGTGEVLHYDGADWSRTPGQFTPHGDPRDIALSHIVEDGGALLLLGSRGTIARYSTEGVLTVEHQNWRLNPRQTRYPWTVRCGDEVQVRTRSVSFHQEGAEWALLESRGACGDGRPARPDECAGARVWMNGAWSVRCDRSERHFVYWSAHDEWVEGPPTWGQVASAWGDESALYAWGGDFETHSMQRWDGASWTREDFPAVDGVQYIHGDEHLVHAVTRLALFRRGRGPAP